MWEVPEEIKEAVEKVKKEVQEEQETQRNGNKRKLEEENENDADVKRQKPSDDQQEATEYVINIGIFPLTRKTNSISLTGWQRKISCGNYRPWTLKKWLNWV